LEGPLAVPNEVRNEGESRKPAKREKASEKKERNYEILKKVFIGARMAQRLNFERF